MARTINAEHVRRSDMFLIPPDQIFVDHKENTRLYKPFIDDLVDGFKTNGQLQPVVVRPLPEGMIQLVAGYRRWLAAMAVVKEQREQEIPYEDRFKLACVVQKMGPSDALLVNIAENAFRENLSPIENAVAIKRLRDTRAWTDAEGTQRIADVFKKSTTWVMKTEELLALSEEHRLAVHQYHVTAGREGISQTVAQILAKTPEANRDKTLRDAAGTSMEGENNTPSGVVNGASTARIKVRDMANAAAKNGADIRKARDAKDLLEFIGGYFDGSEALHPLHPVTVEMLKRIQGFLSRDISEVQLDNTLMKIDRCLAEHYVETKAKRVAGR